MTPQVRYAHYISEDTGETTPLFLHSHEQIDIEIDRRIRGDVNNVGKLRDHEAARVRFHAALEASEKMKETAAA